MRVPPSLLGPAARAAGLCIAAAVLGAGCSAAGPTPRGGPALNAATPSSTTGAPTATTAAPTTVAPTTVAPPAYTPTAPQPSPDDAAARLIDDWSAADRAGAAAIAAPAAVQTLFAVAYPAGWIQPRGCTAASTNPGTCTYRNTETNGIYEITVNRIPAGWYVSAVTPES